MGTLRFLLVSVVLGGVAGCDDSAEASATESRVGPTGSQEVTEPTLFGLQLEGFDDLPPLEVAVRIIPAVDEEGLPTQAAQLVANALRSCKESHSAAGFREPITVHLATASRELEVSESNEPGWARCLADAMAGSTLGEATGPHRVTIQLQRDTMADD